MGSCCSSEKNSGEQSLPVSRPAHPILSSTVVTRTRPTSGGPGRTLGGSPNGSSASINGRAIARSGSANSRTSLIYSTPGRRLTSSSNLIAGERLDARSAAAIAATVSSAPPYHGKKKEISHSVLHLVCLCAQHIHTCDA